MTLERIPFTQVDITDLERSYLIAATKSQNISGAGPFCAAAENFINESLGSNKTLTTTSCSHALELSALLSRFSPGDEIIVPAFAFVTTASSFGIHGAKPVMVDVGDDSLNLDPLCVERAITKRTKAICVIHYAGMSTDIDVLAQLANTYNLTLIEDNAHGLFATFKDKPLGTFGSLSAHSFHSTKNITCGEGGALVINNNSYIERAEILREKGTNRSNFLKGKTDKYTWVDLGSSWVMSDLLGALLLGQLERSSSITERRRDIFHKYAASIKAWSEKYGIQLPVVHDHMYHTGHMFHMRFRRSKNREQFIAHMGRNGIDTPFHYQSLNISKVGLTFGGFVGQCPISERAAECLVRLPIYNSMSDGQVDRVISNVLEFKPSV